MRRLRIGVIAPPWFPVPPVGYGGTELVVGYLVEGLVARGHDVTLFASGGSRTSAKLRSTYAEPPTTAFGEALVEAAHISEAYRCAGEFDLIHDHSALGLLAASQLTIPVVHTIHGAMTAPARRFYATLAHAPNLHFVAVSAHQGTTLPAGLSADVIHNAVEVADFPFSPSPGDYLLFVGRMSPEKGVLDAIEISRKSGIALKMIVKINEQVERDYYEEVARPAMQGLDIQVLEQPPFEVKARAFRDALATLFPIHWAEPFGLVMIESMAAGTPVIAYAEGAVPEIVRPGVNGLICTGVDDAVAALDAVRNIDRQRCRRLVAEQFSVKENVRKHEALYERIAGVMPLRQPAAEPLLLSSAGEISNGSSHTGPLPPPLRAS